VIPCHRFENRTNIILNEIPLIQRRMQTPCKVVSTTSGIPGQSIPNIFVGGISTKPDLTSYGKGHSKWIGINSKEIEGGREGK